MINSLTISSVIVSLGILPSLWLSAKKLKGERNIFSLLVFCVLLFVFATLISACVNSNFLIQSIKEGEGLMKVDIPVELFSYAFLIEGLLIDGFLFLMIRKLNKSNAWKWIVFMMFFSLLIITIMATGISHFSGYSFEKSFFFSCCGSLGFTGAAWGLGYKEICVIGNIYIQLTIFLASFIWLECVIWNRYSNKGDLGNTMLLILGSFYTLGALIFSGWVIYHYAMPLTEAYDLCLNELIALSKKFHITYNEVNYIIFIYGFLFIIILNFTMAKLLTYRKHTNEIQLA